MYEAARIEDHIDHSYARTGLLIGAGLGLVVGVVAAVFTEGVGAVFIGEAISWGGMIGEAIGGLFSHKDGPIVTGAAQVKIGGMLAARAIKDQVECHPGQKIAQGSRLVFIEDAPAARIGDKTECDGSIGEGCKHVFIGREPGTYLNIGSEVEWWLEWGVMLAGLGGALVEKFMTTGFKATLREGWMFLKGGLGAIKGGISAIKKALVEAVSHPVDVATGNVIDSAIDVSLPGMIPVVWERDYKSCRASEQTSYGIGGWTHSLDQWVIADGDLWTLRAEEGRDVYFEKVSSGMSTFHRRERLTLTSDGDGAFTVYDHATQRTRRFASFSGEGGRAWLRSIEDVHGNAVTFSYDEQELLTTVTDTAGRHLRLLRDDLGRILQLDVHSLQEVAQRVRYGYHEAGELAWAEDALGHRDAFEYDQQHRLIRATLKNGVSFYYEYNPEHGRCSKTWGDGGLYPIEFTYDLDIGKTEIRGNMEPRDYYWDDSGLVRRVTTPDGRCLRVCDVDDDGFVIAEGPTESACTRHEYDERGNRCKTVDPAGAATAWKYDGDVPVSLTSPDGLVTLFAHDARHNLTAVTYATGVHYRLTRDLHGRLTSIRENDRTVAAFAYDRMHDVVSETDARGATTSYRYDELGRPVERRDALARMWRIERDALGRPVSMHAPDGTVTRAEHDALGNVTRTIDALGQVTEMEYAGTGVLARFVQPDGHAYSMTYDSDERLIGVENPLGEKYNYKYDEAGRLAFERTFDGRTLGYRYSNEGHLSYIDSPDGAVRSLQRDARGLVVADIASDTNVRFDRDLIGRITKAELTERSGKVVVEIKRDQFGRVVEEVQNGRSVKYTYDEQGRRIERVLANGATTRYGHDDAGALAWLDHDGRRFSLERDEIGREVARRSAGGFELRNTYDEMDRLVERQAVGSVAHGILSRRTWSYDALGRIREVTDNRWGTTLYSHDPISQLLSAHRGTFREAFSYDPAGSLRKLTDELSGSAMAGDWECERGNRLVRTDDAEYVYDRRGRRIKKVTLGARADFRRGETTHYMWDVRDRLREVKKPDGSCVRFTYDAFGRRVRKEVLAAEGMSARRTVEFLWDGDQLAADIDSTRGTRTFVHEPGTFIPMIQAEQGEVFAVVNDHLGMPKDLVDGDGRVAWSAAHSAWAEVVEEYRDPSSRRKYAVESPFRLLGQYADEETGLSSTRFRYFDAETGRWCSPDPLGIDGGNNLYRFDGSPISEIDPLGLCKESVWSLNPFKRGQVIEKALGQNLPSNFPVVDKFEKGLVTSIKSLDLNAATYQDMSKLTQKVTGYIDKVQKFNGTRWAGVEIKGSQISGKALDLAVPGAGSPAQQKALQELVNYGQSVGVKLNTIIFP